MGTAKPLTYPGRVVDQIIGGSKSARYARQDPKSPQYDPTWPLPIKLSVRTTVYFAHEIQQWLESRPRTRTTHTKGAQ